MWKTELAAELNSASPKERRAIIASCKQRTGLSEGQLYRIAKTHGFVSGRSKRADKGSLRCGLTDSQVESVAALISTSARDKKGPILIVKDALEITFDNGIIERGQVTPATMSRILRERQINAEALRRERPHTEMRSLHPNHVHVVDASVCIQYYLKNGKTALLRESEYIKRNLHGKIKTRILRYLLVDHFSGLIFPYYFDTSGETKENLYEFLVRAWEHKDDDRFPFRGVPSIILWDRASANIAKAMERFLVEGLDVELPPGMPHNKMRQGAVEVAQNIVERRFESKLAFHPAWSIEELREWSRDWAIWYNATQKHTRHCMTRSQCWSLIKTEQLRELPSEDMLQDLFHEPEKQCTVTGAYSISFRGKQYRLKHVEGLFRGAKVQAVLKPFKWPLIDVVFDGQAYEAAPVEKLSPAEGGFSTDAAVIGKEYKAPRETETQKAQKRFDNMAYGEKRKPGAVPFEGITVHNIHADKLGNMAFMPREGTPIEVDNSAVERLLPVIDLIKRLGSELGSLTPGLNARIRRECGETVRAGDMDRLVEKYKLIARQSGGEHRAKAM